MSKAFTKEDDQAAPVIGRRRAPLPEGVSNYVTKAGLRALRDELTQLVAAHATAGAATDSQVFNARRLELEQRIAGAVLPQPPADRSEIRFGARVRLADGAGGRREVHIVGVDEANPSSDAIAFVAPLARALLGRRTGDVVTVRTPGGEEDLEILGVAYDDPA